jgi:hypothetical protein
MKDLHCSDLIIINVIALVAYFAIFSGLQIGVSESIMFSTNDAVSYLNVSHFNSGLTEIDALSVRPFLYPLIIALTHNTVGPYGLWIFQLIMWLCALNLLFIAVNKVSNSRIIAFLVLPVYISNLSLIALTLHALTEITTVFLLSVLIWFISSAISRRKEIGFIHRVLLILVLLTLVKPLFYPVVLFVVFVILPLFYFKEYRKVSKKLITLLIVLSPMILQQGFMKVHAGEFKVSMIGDITIRDYIFAQTLALDKGIDRDSSLVEVKKYDPAEVREYLLSHPANACKAYLINLVNNCNGYPLYLDHPPGKGTPAYVKFMIGMNNIYYQLHLFFVVLNVLIMIVLLLSKRMNDLIILISSSLLLYYILLTSGISAYQYDRLTICSFPLWIFLYLVTICYFSEILKPNIKKIAFIFIKK